MNFSRAFAFIFEDRDWFSKVALTFVITAAALALTLPIVGLALWALLLGYQSDLVRNWRAGRTHPLPAWGHWSARLNEGANILVAAVVYNLPNLLLSCCAALTFPAISNTFTGAGTTIAIACCLFPLLLAYNLVIWPMLALGLARFQDEGRLGVYFEFGRLFALVRDHTDLTIQYLLTSLFAGILFTLLALTIVGVVVVLALGMIVSGALTGQYTVRVLGKPRHESVRSLR